MRPGVATCRCWQRYGQRMPASSTAAAPPPALEAAPALEIAVSGDEATATLGVDRWRFTRRDGRWWLLELAY